MIPFREQTTKVDYDSGSIFDDSYKYKQEDSGQKQQKFVNQYVKGNLKTNIIFDDQYVTLYFI